MPTLEINATQLWLISQSGSVVKAERRLSVVEMATAVSANLHNAFMGELNVNEGSPHICPT